MDSAFDHEEMPRETIVSVPLSPLSMTSAAKDGTKARGKGGKSGGRSHGKGQSSGKSTNAGRSKDSAKSKGSGKRDSGKGEDKDGKSNDDQKDDGSKKVGLWEMVVPNLRSEPGTGYQR